MRRTMKLAAGAVVLAAAAATLTGCTTDSDRVSQNLSTDAEQFRVSRQITFYNGITDKYVAVVNGRCSVDDASADLPGQTLAVTCETAPGKYIKDYLGLADNVTWFAIQVGTDAVSPYHYEIVFKPQNVIPSFTGSDQ